MGAGRENAVVGHVSALYRTFVTPPWDEAPTIITPPSGYGDGFHGSGFFLALESGTDLLLLEDGGRIVIEAGLDLARGSATPEWEREGSSAEWSRAQATPPWTRHFPEGA